MSTSIFRKRIGILRKMREELAAGDVQGLHVYISSGNIKMGRIPSISLLPVIDCTNCKLCANSCYDLRHDMIRPQGMSTRLRNSVLCTYARDRYFREIDAYLVLHEPSAFRWHVGGDIKDLAYLEKMCEIARVHKRTQFLAFTKNYCIVNEYIDTGHEVPSNLHLIFSGWIGLEMENPHDFPTAHPLFPNSETSAPNGAKLCTGNCTDCLVRRELCWILKKGEAVVFPAH